MPLSTSTDLLASVEDLAAYLQETVDTASATVALAGATGLIRAEAGQTLTYVANDVYVPTGDPLSRPERMHFAQPYANVGDTDYSLGWDIIISLPERPVDSVASVGGAAAGSWRLDGNDLLIPAWVTWSFPLTITYSHGYQNVPTDLQFACLSAAGRFYGNPQNIRTESLGPYTVSYSGPGDPLASGGALTAGEKQIARRYRPFQVTSVRTVP